MNNNDLNKIMSSTNIITNDIIDNLFAFLEKYFDIFECKGLNFKWWFNKSWSPFVESCFIIWGKELKKNNKIDEIGHSFTHPEITEFMDRIGHGPYDINTKFQDRGFDVSWHGSGGLYLAIEHEETIGGRYQGPTVESHLQHIYDEMEKLGNSTAKVKVIISRPHLRVISGRKDTYPKAIEYYRKNIESKLLKLNPNENERWIVILLGPENRLKPQEETKILVCCYDWNGIKLPMYKEKKLRIKMNYDGNVKKI